MGSLKLTYAGDADTVSIYHLTHKSSTDGVTRLMDVGVDNADPALVITIGKPDATADERQATKGRAQRKPYLVGDELGAETLADDAGLIEHLSGDSIREYVFPRIMTLLSRVHGVPVE